MITNRRSTVWRHHNAHQHHQIRSPNLVLSPSHHVPDAPCMVYNIIHHCLPHLGHSMGKFQRIYTLLEYLGVSSRYRSHYPTGHANDQGWQQWPSAWEIKTSASASARRTRGPQVWPEDVTGRRVVGWWPCSGILWLNMQILVDSGWLQWLLMADSGWLRLAMLRFCSLTSLSSGLDNGWMMFSECV